MNISAVGSRFARHIAVAVVSAGVIFGGAVGLAATAAASPGQPATDGKRPPAAPAAPAAPKPAPPRAQEAPRAPAPAQRPATNPAVRPAPAIKPVKPVAPRGPESRVRTAAPAR